MQGRHLQLGKCSRMFLDWSTCVHLHPPAPTYIHLHPPTSTCIHLHVSLERWTVNPILRTLIHKHRQHRQLGDWKTLRIGSRTTGTTSRNIHIFWGMEEEASIQSHTGALFINSVPIEWCHHCYFRTWSSWNSHLKQTDISSEPF